MPALCPPPQGFPWGFLLLTGLLNLGPEALPQACVSSRWGPDQWDWGRPQDTEPPHGVPATGDPQM